MTLRLVALMSVVLLLCLGAFGLIANHYHQQVLEEAAQIASRSAKAVFGTLDSSQQSDFFHFTQRGSGMPAHPAAGSRNQAQLMIVGDVDPDEAQKLIEEVTQRRFGRAIDLETETRTLVEGTGEATYLSEVFVSVEDIHASSDDEGLTLRIPTYLPEPTDRQTAQGAWTADDKDDRFELVRLNSGDESIDAKVSEIKLPISVSEYDSMFDGVRRQSMFLFLGVFLVGIVLSAGAAARFTRPARRLDAALRELSDGDLETEVEVRGNDEMARLGLAFNQMSRKLRANRERAREMVRRDKLSALGRLAAGVAHDVRNPLHSIGLTLSHLGDTGRPVDVERAAEFDRSVAMIRGEIRRLDQLVVNFLRFANGDHRERQAVDLRALIEETARLVRKEAEWRGIELTLDLEDVPEVMVDVESIRSSLLNLVLNSCEAMPKGGKLDIVLRDEDGELTVEVGDTGRGIPSDQREKVFDFGYSTREGGSGLGLVMVHQCVVEDHHGRVTLQSEEGQGTRVRLVLPLNPPEQG